MPRIIEMNTYLKILRIEILRSVNTIKIKVHDYPLKSGIGASNSSIGSRCLS